MKCAKNANIVIDDFGALDPSSSSRSCMTPLAILTFLEFARSQVSVNRTRAGV